MQKIFIAKILAPPSDLKNFSPSPPFAMKIMGQPHRKACKLNFHWKICGIFSRPPPLTRVTNFKGLPFWIRPLPQQVFVNGLLCII